MPGTSAIHKNRLLSFTGKIGDLLLGKIKTVDENYSLYKASKIFVNPAISFLVVVRNNIPVGVVPRKKVVARGIDKLEDKNRPVLEIMETQPITVQKEEPVFETLMYMIKHRLNYLLVMEKEKPLGVITQQDWLSVKVNHPTLLIKKIERAENVDRLAGLRKESTKEIWETFQKEGNALSLTEITTVINDSLVKRIIQLSLEQMQKTGKGLPPVPFAWIGMGSEGRKSQTVRTDQDNGLIFDNVPEKEYEEVKQWFLEFAEIVVSGLETCGFPLCRGNMMATNPMLCNSFDKWKKQFEKIIHLAEAKELLEASIIFDFRCVYGKAELSDQLWEYLFESIDRHPFFMRFFGENMLQASRPPINKWQWKMPRFLNITLPKLDIKREVTASLDAAVRLLAIHHNIRETSTPGRLKLLLEKGGISKAMADHVHVAFDFVLRLRFKLEYSKDTKYLEEHLINPNELMPMEVRNLRDAMETIYRLQDYAFKQVSGMDVPWSMR